MFARGRAEEDPVEQVVYKSVGPAHHLNKNVVVTRPGGTETPARVSHVSTI
jgi:hypothetical protein